MARPKKIVEESIKENKMEGTISEEVSLQPEQITFEIDDTTYMVPAPLPVKVWFWIWEKSFSTPDINKAEDVEALNMSVIDLMATNTEEILYRAIGEKQGIFSEYKDIIDGVCIKLLQQMRKELLGIAPFTKNSVERGAEILKRKLILAGYEASTTGQTQSQSNQKSVVETGNK